MATTTTYADFPTLTPTKSDKVVGGVASDSNIYCRHCMYRLGMDWSGMKYITKSRAKAFMYNCCKCGWRVSTKRMNKIVIIITNPSIRKKDNGQEGRLPSYILPSESAR